MQLESWERLLGRWAFERSDISTPASSSDQPSLDAAQIASLAREQAASADDSTPPPSAGEDDATLSEDIDEHKDQSVAQRSIDTAWLDSIEQSAMACEFEVLLNHGQYPQGLEKARDAMRVIHVLEDELSVYRSTSDFSNINRWASQRPIAVRFDVCQMLEVAAEVSRATGRAFDITAGSLSEVWGFSRRQGRKPDDDELARALECVGADLVSIDSQNRTVSLARAGVKLNPGGIGKGYALDRVAGGLVDAGLDDFLIHGGRSSIAARGSRWSAANSSQAANDAQSGWWIALAHPLRWEEKLGRIRLRNQALGTSGAGKQFFHYQGVRYSHVIDPRTGWPAQGVLSATAICHSGTLADALATAFMIMGADGTREFCQRYPSFSAVLVSLVPNSNRLAIDLVNFREEDWQPNREL